MRMRVGALMGVGAVAFLVAGCAGGGNDDDGDAVSAPPTVGSDVIAVTSAAFAEGQPIPEQYTCDGDEVSPPLAWTGVPSDAAELALVVDDPDAPGGGYVHWVVVGIDPATTSVDEGQPPAGGTQLANSGGTAVYAGPCPPSGAHHYRFTVYALDSALGLDPDTTLDDAFAAIDGHAVAQGRLTGTYARS